MAESSSDVVYERVAETDPNRCQGIIGGSQAGQCNYKAVPGCKFCMMHGGSGQASDNKKGALKNYRIQQWGEQIGDKANSSDIKSLREEIGILRMLMETTLNHCKNANDLLIYSDKIGHLTEKIQKLVESCQKMEEKNNQLLDRKVVIVIADSIVTLIGEYVTDPDMLDEIGAKICNSIEAAASPQAAAVSNH